MSFKFSYSPELNKFVLSPKICTLRLSVDEIDAENVKLLTTVQKGDVEVAKFINEKKSELDVLKCQIQYFVECKTGGCESPSKRRKL